MSKKLKMAVIGAIGAACVGLGIYGGAALYFNNHLQMGTIINGVNVGGKTVEVANLMIKESAKDYTLTLDARNNGQDQILGKDIQYTYLPKDEVTKIQETQNPFLWIKGLWSEKEYEAPIQVAYDQAKLQEKINELDCKKAENNIAPVDATVELINGQYEIVKESEGSQIKPDVLAQEIYTALNSRLKDISLDEKECYEVAKVTSTDPMLLKNKDKMNHYISSEITYDFGNQQEVVNKDLIATWLTTDENNEVILDEEAIGQYVRGLSREYSTYGMTRDFNTSVGTTVKVVGGDYGSLIDRKAETKELMALLEQGNQKVTRKPIYAQEAYITGPNDIGDTYVEINLSRQYLWFYKDKQLVTEGSIVSGTGTNSYATPAGTYKLDYKQRGATLRGPGYATRVSYWMPFNRDIGIHDATWRNSFGGSIYMYNGSHGCINAPIGMASAIFEQIEDGMPIVCYHD